MEKREKKSPRGAVEIKAFGWHLDPQKVAWFQAGGSAMALGTEDHAFIVAAKFAEAPKRGRWL